MSVIDLDALIPEPATVKFGGQEIKVNPPKTADVLKLGFLGQKLQAPEDLSDEALDKLLNDLTGQVKKCIPELASAELNTAQLLKLVELISKMAMPPDAQELEDRGITVDTQKKTA